MSATTDKAALRKQLRTTRREHAASIPDNMRALLFKRPPAPLMELIAPNAMIGLYHATMHEAPAVGYARFLSDEGHTIALPRFAEDGDAAGDMNFATFTDPYGETDLVAGPKGIMQPDASAKPIAPDVLFVPLLGFTDHGARLGQGGGHYDRWLGEHPGTLAIGMGWDCQMVDELPTEPHDMPLSAVVTPTRLYGPF